MNTREVFCDWPKPSELICTYSWYDGHNGYVIDWLPTLIILPGHDERGTFAKPFPTEAETIHWILTHVAMPRRQHFRFRSRSHKTTLHFSGSELTSPDLDDIQSELNCEP